FMVADCFIDLAFFTTRRSSDLTTNNSEYYLVNERGFDSTFVQRLAKADFIKQGKPRQDRQTKEWQKPAILFPWHDENDQVVGLEDRKSTRLNSSHVSISYAVFC